MSRERRSAAAIGVAVFLAGAALLGLEIAASRVLAPYFGNSLYVWGALIGVVLAGLSTGYWVGGAIADRYPTSRLLVAMLASASLLVLAIPFVDEWVLEHLVEWDPGPRLNPLLATIFLFGVQSVILGTVSPIAVRLKARSLDHLGRTAGRLFAVSTAGSIAGTFLTSFWLIPELGTDQVLASAAVALMLAAAGIAVVEDDTSRYLRFDSSFQSGMYVDDPFKTRFGYSDYLQLPVAYQRQTKRVLYVGLGGGSAPKRAWRDFPGMQIDVVELDPEVVSAAYKYFAVPRDPRLKVEVEDGRRFLARNEGPWDVIVVDAFYSDSIPFHLATREFLELVRSRLAPGGLVAANIIGSVTGSESRLFRSMLRTYRAVFPTVSIHPVLDAGGKDLSGIRQII